MRVWLVAAVAAAEVCMRTPERCVGHENMCDCAGYDAASFRPEIAVYAGKNESLDDFVQGTCGYANAACELKWAVVCCEDTEAPSEDSEFQPEERELQTQTDFETADEFCARAGFTITEFDYDLVAFPGEGFTGPTGYMDGTCGNVVAMAQDEFATCCCYDSSYCCPQGADAEDCMSRVDDVLVTGSYSYSYVAPVVDVQICPTMEGLDLSVCLENGLEDDDCCAALEEASCAPGFAADTSMPVSCGDGLYYTCCYSSCVDSTTWHKNGEPSKDCSWVADFVPERCDAKGNDRTFAAYSCPVACGGTCADSTEWYKNGEPSKTCAWVSIFPESRCLVKGSDGTLGSYSCPDACGLDGTIVDSTSWYKNDEPDKDCVWVHRFASARCDAKGEDGTFAYEACVRSCSDITDTS